MVRINFRSDTLCSPHLNPKRSHCRPEHLHPMAVKTFLKNFLTFPVMGNCLGALVVTGLLAVGGLLMAEYYTHHGVEVVMPNLCGQSEEVAVKKLKALDLRVEISDTGYVKTLPPGTILEQSIRAGYKLKPGRLVSLTINSAGSPTIALPDLTDNCSRREAESRLMAIGLKLAPVEFILGEKGWVYGVKVNGRAVSAGTRIPVGSAVTLVVGNGETEEVFNGNDSLEYEVFGDYEEEYPEEVIETEEDPTDIPAIEEEIKPSDEMHTEDAMP